MISILGEQIGLIRPSPPPRPLIYKSERPYARNQAKTKTIKKHCGRVAAIAVLLISGGIRECLKGTHSHVLEVFDIDPANVAQIGWRLENGEYLWR